MKILYIKNGNDRAKPFQLQTLIYEENGKKFVKKRALCPEAVPHLKAMKDHYLKLTKSILDPRIKLAQIVGESDESLTFEFIAGESFQTRLNQGKISLNESIELYLEILKNGFRTAQFQSTQMVTKTHRELFGDIDYGIFDGEPCFEGVSNIDLIFSNIIFQGEDIYLIDYEWVFEGNLPITYSLFRALAYTPTPNQKEGIPARVISTLHSIEDHFIGTIETPDSFAKFQKAYQKPRLKLQSQDNECQNKEQAIRYWKETAESMRIKNRLLRIIKKLRPGKKG